MNEFPEIKVAFVWFESWARMPHTFKFLGTDDKSFVCSILDFNYRVSQKNVTFVRFWVYYLGRNVFRGSFSPEIDWWWSHMLRHLSFMSKTRVFAHKACVFLPTKIVFSTRRTCLGHVRPSPMNVWGKTIPNNTLPKVKNSNPDKSNGFFWDTL